MRHEHNVHNEHNVHRTLHDIESFFIKLLFSILFPLRHFREMEHSNSAPYSDISEKKSSGGDINCTYFQNN